LESTAIGLKGEGELDFLWIQLLMLILGQSMKTKITYLLGNITGTLCFLPLAALGAEEAFRLSMNRLNGQPLLCLESPASGTTETVGVRIQASQDLLVWNNLGEKQLLPAGRTGPRSYSVNTNPDLGFYRALVSPKTQFTGADGAEVFGYAEAFADELAALGNLSLDGFARLYSPTEDYLPQITFDVSQANYWKEICTTPDRVFSFDAGRSQQPIAPNEVEKTFLRKNGFVVASRAIASTFGDAYYGIFARDLPVLITTDSILHAWHRSYDTMLEQLEEAYLSTCLEKILFGMASQVPAATKAYGDGVMRESLLDADCFLKVARSLLGGPSLAQVLSQETSVSNTLALIQAGKPAYLDLFGRPSRPGADPLTYLVDFSQFKIRGHYTESERLGHYFQAIIWCGRMDLRVAGPTDLASPRELGTAIVLLDLLVRSGQLELWRNVDNILQVFVGRSDYLNFDQLADLLRAISITSPIDIKSPVQLEQLQTAMLEGDLGFQQIQSHNYVAPAGGGSLQLPRSFAFLGQRFTLDSWVFNQVVYSRVPLTASGGVRRIPSALDSAFAVFGNNAPLSLILDRMQNAKGVPFRDNVPYAVNLAAVRRVIDNQRADVWDDNIYAMWLAALRTLSEPTTGSEYPEAMRTRTWALKQLNTQLASWTQLRHDTIAYAKQTVSTDMGCVYPHGFVEPVPRFYQQMAHMMQKASACFNDLPMTGSVALAPSKVFGGPINLGDWKQNAIKFLRRSADVLGVLMAISQKELSQQPLTSTENDFLKNLIERHEDYFGRKTYSGWYPGLFYVSNEGRDGRLFPEPSPWSPVQSEATIHDCDRVDTIVTDVHTDPASPTFGDPGSVLHEGVGFVYNLLIAVNNGPDYMMFAGPVFSHFEFLKPDGVRLSDEEWTGELFAGRRPPNPEWTHEYLVSEDNP
jgi:hypothetical protein